MWHGYGMDIHKDAHTYFLGELYYKEEFESFKCFEPGTFFPRDGVALRYNPDSSVPRASQLATPSRL
jgi:hypothetical protein